MQPLFRMFDVPCFYRGELVADCGKAKSGKTFFLSILMAGALKNQMLALERLCEEPLKVLWMDTEQSQQSTQEILKDRIMPLAEVESLNEAQFYAFNLRGLGFEMRGKMVDVAIRTIKPDICIIDGVKDLMTDINDAVQATLIMEKLMALAKEQNCCIVCVLHLNKSEQDCNMRGSIGTELTHKAFEIWNCEKMLPERIFCIEQTLTRKAEVRRMLYFEVDKDGLPVHSDGPSQVMASSTASQKQKKPLPPLNREYIIHHDEDDSFEVDIRKLFYDALKGGALFYSALQQKAMGLLNCQDSGCWNNIFVKAKEKGLVRHITIDRKSMWALPERVKE